MNLSWKRNLPAILFVTIFLVADLGMGVTIDSLIEAPQIDVGAVDDAERTWEGGGNRLLFVDTMSRGLSTYYEQMDPLPDGKPFDYYGGAVPEAYSVESTWQPERWRNELWRWGEESIQFTESNGNGEIINAWSQLDEPGGLEILRFGENKSYPEGAFSSIISPVIDLRSVLPVDGMDADARYRLDQPTHGLNLLDSSNGPGGVGVGDGDIANNRQVVYGVVGQSSVADLSQDHASLSTPPPHNASAALRVRHAYGFQTNPESLRDGARMEVSYYTPIDGWLEWQPLLPSVNALRVGDEKLEGRYATPLGGAEVGITALYPKASPEDGVSFENPDVTGGISGQAGIFSGRPWMYQGLISASEYDDRGTTWNGFGGQSNGLVESVFDLTAHAGHLIRIRFVAATGGSSINSGLGWILDQMEVHAAGQPGVELLAPITPAEGSILNLDADPPLIIALQNTYPESVDVLVRTGIEGAGTATDRATVPSGPWGRLFHTMPETLRDISPGTTGLQHLAITVMEMVESGGGMDVPALSSAAEGRFHFQLGGPNEWRAVQVTTELVSMEGDGPELNIGGRTAKRGQEILIHVDLENLGPEEIELDFSNDAPLEPVLLDTFRRAKGTFGLPEKVSIPPSRDTSGPLGSSDSLSRATWRWSGIPQATLLDLVVNRVDNDGNQMRVLDGGVVRVETMQPSVLSVDLGNHWSYSPIGLGDGCRRAGEVDGRQGILTCINDAITSPEKPIYSSDLRRGVETSLFISYRGSGIIKLEINDSDPNNKSPSLGSQWKYIDIIEAPAVDDWNAISIDMDDFEDGWRGWVRISIESTNKKFEIDELRLDVGPRGREFPIIWHTFSSELSIEESGSLRSLSGGVLAILDASLARSSNLPIQPEVSILGREGIINYDDDEISVDNQKVGVDGRGGAVKANSKIPASSILELPGPYLIDGARPTLHFRHWMSPGASAVGFIEVARAGSSLVDDDTFSATGGLIWEQVAFFPANLAGDEVYLSPTEVPLWSHAGSEIFIRFRYEFNPLVQPNDLPVGWVIDDVKLKHTGPINVEYLHISSGNYEIDGYKSIGVQYKDLVSGDRRAKPIYNGDHFSFGRTAGRNHQHPDVAPMCSTVNRPNTYATGQSIITDAMDLRALDNPVLVLEHGGHFGAVSSRNPRVWGAPFFDIEYQTMGRDGRWQPWQRATPHDAQWNGLDTDVTDPAGGFVYQPFAVPSWDGDLKDDDATIFSLAKSVSGEIARFRFHAWEQYPGSGVPGAIACNRNSVEFNWNVYSMEIYEDTHLFDAEPLKIEIFPNDIELLEKAGLKQSLNSPPSVVAGDAATVDVWVHNDGLLPHMANVTLELVRNDGVPVTGVVRYLERTGEGPGRLTTRPYGAVQLQPGEEKIVSFRTEFNKVEPGLYITRAVVDLNDALDTNPRNDFIDQQVLVIPIRSLEVAPSSKVVPVVGTPNEPRILTLDVRNLGNVKDSAEINVKVVELLGVGRERDIGPVGGNGLPMPYQLRSQMVEDLASRTGVASLQWDLSNDVHPSNDLELESLLRPGSRYAVNVTLAPTLSVGAWWADGEIPDDIDVVDLSDLGTRCGCMQIPFLVEGLLASSDLIQGGAVLDGYVAGGIDEWETQTSVYVDGVWQDASGRLDLPSWRVLDSGAAAKFAGEPGRGPAWQLPAYDGYETIRHTLTSPPLPGQVIDPTSQAILDLQYARSDGNRGDVEVQVRTLEPGGVWGEWGPVDGLRAKRVAVVLPPDYPRVFSNRTDDHPIPPFYTKDAVKSDNNLALHQWSGLEASNVGVIPDVCNGPPRSVTVSSSTPECEWSPFPLFHRLDENGYNWSLEVLAEVLQKLADQIGENNLGIFTTFPSGQSKECFTDLNLDAMEFEKCFGEFGVPIGGIGEHGVEFDPLGFPRLRIQAGDPLALPHEVPVLSLDDLGQSLGTYGALLVMGDGLSRYVAGRGVGESLYSQTLGDLSTIHPDSTLTNEDIVLNGFDEVRITIPSGTEITTNELDQHFSELLQILRFAPNAGVSVVGGLGPASASIGLSGVAEDVPLAVWIPNNTPRLPDNHPANNKIPLPLVRKCLIEDEAGNAYTGLQNKTYVLNISSQPKPICGRPGMGDVFLYTGNYIYASGEDTQAFLLRDLARQGGAQTSFVKDICGPINLPYLCVQPLKEPISHQSGSIKFVTAAQPRHASAWVDQILLDLASDGLIPPGDGGWQNLPVEMTTPVGGKFRPGPEGSPRFVGETMQFRVVVRSDPNERGSDGFLFDSFRLLGTPSDDSDLEVRIVEPASGSIRQPGERGFFVTAEVINRGLTTVEQSGISVRMGQIPGDGDCSATCVVHAFHPASQGPLSRALQIPAIAPGSRYIVTLGPQPLQAGIGVPGDLVYAASCTVASCLVEPFNGGVFPRVPVGSPKNPELRFDITSEITNGPNIGIDKFTELNDAQSITAHGINVINHLVKDESWVTISPNQASINEISGIGDAIPVTKDLSIHVKLANDGSRPIQVGHIRAEIHLARPNDCFNSGAGSYYSCRYDGSPTPISLWNGVLNALELSRGTTSEYTIPANLEHAGFASGVYVVEVEVETVGHSQPIQTFRRWVYLADSADGPWAFNQEDLSGIHSNNDVVGSNSGVWGGNPQSNGSEGSPFFMTLQSPCRQDNATRAGTQLNGRPLEHGWRLSDESTDACQRFQDSGSHALHWVRNATSAWDHAQSSWTVSGGGDNNPPTAARSRGVADFGPDPLIWNPGHAENRVDKEEINGVVHSLANFAPGSAALVLDTRYQATPNTAFVVEMQVPIRFCTSSGGSFPSTTCNWRWDWGNTDSTHWFPLQAVGGVTTDSPTLGISDRAAVAGCITPETGGLNPNPSAVCTRNRPTNPLGGLPGIWGTNSTDLFTSDRDGWAIIRYPIDIAAQEQNVSGSARLLYSGLEGYCSQLILFSDSFVDSSIDPLHKCMFAWAQGGCQVGGQCIPPVQEEIPRPVAFRFRAASYAGDEGANRWQIRDLSLTAHNLKLEGAKQFEVPFIDGDTKAIPVEIRNVGPVDDVVEVRGLSTFAVGGLRVGVATHSVADSKDELTLRIPAGASRTVWVHIRFDFGAGGLTPGIEHRIPIDVQARSLIAPSVGVSAVVDAVLTPLHRADLVIGTMVVDGNDDGQVEASEGVPVHTTLLVRNQGSRPVDGEPVLVRLLAKELDPDDHQNVLGAESVAQVVLADSFGSHCFQDRCSVPVSLDWTPDRQGVFELVAEVNLPRLGDEVVQVPESDDANNVGRRVANVGAVPLADLQILDVRVVPFDAGCAPVERAVERLVAGHSYCLAAHVTNAGSRAAVEPVAEFSIGASAPFSRGQGDGLPNPLNASVSAWVYSSPVRASLPRVGDLMEFQVQLDTRSTTASVEAKDRILLVPVDDYDLELLVGDLSDLDLVKGGQSTVSLRMRNTGTAVATPTLDTEGADGFRIHLSQVPPLQPGEEVDVELVLRAGLSAAEGTHDLDVVFSTVEDALVRVPLQLRPTVGEEAPAQVTVLPLRSAPGKAVLDVAVDNTVWARNGTWIAVETTGPLTLLESVPLEAAGHGVVLHTIPVTVAPRTDPGEHVGMVRFLVTHGIITTTVDAPYTLVVEPAPRLFASLEQADVAAVHGVDARLTLFVENPGNVPVEATVAHVVDSGTVLAGNHTLVLRPGDNHTLPLTVRAGEASRSLGESTVRWRAVGSEWTEAEPVLWSVHFVPGTVRIQSTDLGDLRIQPGAVQAVRAFLHNPGVDSVHAEAILVADGVLMSRERVELAPGAIQAVDLAVQLEAGDHVLQVLARPVGAQVGLGDPVFHAVGDVDVRELTVEEDGGGVFSDLSIPVPGMLLYVLVLLGAAVVWGRRKD